jgi:predicted permease
VLVGVDVPQLFDNMLMLIGSTTSGASIFLAGLIIAAYEIKLNAEIILNTLIKMVAQPLLMAVLVVRTKFGQWNCVILRESGREMGSVLTIDTS